MIFKQQLNTRIEVGEEIFKRAISSNQELDTLDNDYNQEMLKQAFNNPENEHWLSYASAGYTLMGDPDGSFR